MSGGMVLSAFGGALLAGAMLWAGEWVWFRYHAARERRRRGATR